MDNKKHTKRKAVVYLRIAHTAQAADVTPRIAAQRRACLEIAHSLQVKIFDEYIDIGSSARTLERPGMQRLLRRCASGDIRYVIASDDARLGRNSHDLAELRDRLRRRSTRIVTGPSVLADKSCSILVDVMAAIDHHERAERAKAGWVKRRTRCQQDAGDGRRQA